MTLFHKVRRKQFQYSRLIVITIFWVMLIFSLVLSYSMIKYCSMVPYRRDMAFIQHNVIPLARSVADMPEGYKQFANFNIECMFLHVKAVKESLELYSLAVLFFTINTLIMLFVAYRKNKTILYLMSFLIIIYGYFSFTYSRTIIDSLPGRILGGVVFNSEENNTGSQNIIK